MLLLDHLAQLYPDSSRRTLRHWIKWERVSVDGVVVKQADLEISTEQKIELSGKEKPRIFGGIEILFQDRWLVVINKPEGLLSVPSDNPGELHALGLLRKHFNSSSIFAVHRIDRETSGVLLFARGTRAEEKLDLLFAAHALKRQYFAIVEGRMAQERGTWRHFLREKPNYSMEITSPDQGKEAITHFAVLRRSKKFTYLTLSLETGKKHQIRVQCSEAGHPILGDKRYGSLVNPIKRLALHAETLSFVHPFTNQTLTITSPLPKAFSKLL